MRSRLFALSVLLVAASGCLGAETLWIRDFQARGAVLENFAPHPDGGLATARATAPGLDAVRWELRAPVLPAGASGLPRRERDPDGQTVWLLGDTPLRLPRPDAPLFAPGGHPGSFTLIFRFRPDKVSGKASLLSLAGGGWDRESWTAQAMWFGLEEGRFVARLDGLLLHPDARRSVRLATRKPLAEGAWHQVSFRIDGAKGVAELLVGDRVEARAELARPEGEKGAGDLPRVGFLPHHAGELVIGEDFVGALASVRSYDRPLADVAARAWPDSLSKWQSRVFPLPARSRVSMLGLDELRGNSRADLFVRLSESPFLEDDESIAWQAVPTGRALEERDELRGRWAQLRLVLKNQNAGGPNRIASVRVDTLADPVPLPPEVVRVTPLAGSVEVEWLVGHEEDLAGFTLWCREGEGPLVRADARRVEVAFRPEDRKETHRESKVVARVTGLENGKVYRVGVTARDRLGDGRDSGFGATFTVIPDAWAGGL